MIKEDEEGFLEASVTDIIQRAKRKRQTQRKANTKLGMMRHMFIIIDCSDSMSNQDLKPTRLLCTIKVTTCFYHLHCQMLMFLTVVGVFYRRIL